MKIELNGKGLIAASLLAVSIVSASFVSVINANSSGGVVFATPEYNVGSVVFRMDDVNPSTIYGGTWELVRGEAALYFGDGSNLDGQISDPNYMKTIPLPKHTHASTVSSNTHSHKYINPSYGYANIIAGNETRRFGDSGSESFLHYSTTSDTHSHTVTLSEEGIDNPTIDVRDSRIYINVWKRIN